MSVLSEEINYDAVLTDWRIVPCDLSRVICIGRIHGDNKNRFLDGDVVKTSSIQSFDLNTMIITTRNTRYKLINS